MLQAGGTGGDKTYILFSVVVWVLYYIGRVGYGYGGRHGGHGWVPGVALSGTQRAKADVVRGLIEQRQPSLGSGTQRAAWGQCRIGQVPRGLQGCDRGNACKDLTGAQSP